MTCDEQLDQWVAGIPIHRGDKQSASSECCPDFSCCYPKLLQPLEVRQKYRDGTQRQREAMLGGFLTALVESLGVPNVRIVGIPEDDLISAPLQLDELGPVPIDSIG